MSIPIRAMLLAAGLGTRLRPITLNTPKCLVDVGGKPLLERWLTKLEDAGCEAVLINTHYLADQVRDFIMMRQGSEMTIEVTYEPELLGTAGTLLANRGFFKDATGLLIHADNAMAEGLGGLLEAHRRRPPRCEMTMMTFDTIDPQSCGIVLTTREGVILEFHEKVSNPPGNCANGALYAFSSSLLEVIANINPQPSDFSKEVIPRLIGMINSYHTQEPYIDVGTLDALKSANGMDAFRS